MWVGFMSILIVLVEEQQADKGQLEQMYAIWQKIGKETEMEENLRKKKESLNKKKTPKSGLNFKEMRKNMSKIWPN